MKIVIRNITDEMLNDVYKIHQEKLGEGYLNYEYFKKLRDNGSNLMVAVENDEVIGYLVYDIMSELEFFASKHIDQQGSDVPCLCLLTMAVKYEREGIGTFLTKSCMEKYGKRVGFAYCPVWKSTDGINAHNLLINLGFVPGLEVEDYWYEESKGIENFCPVCDNPCTCSLVVYKYNFQKSETLELQGYNYFFSAYGDDAKVLHQVFGYKLNGKETLRCSFDAKSRENVVNRLESLHINYRIVLYGNLINQGTFTDNQYNNLLKEYNSIRSKITKYDIIDGLINGYDVYTGEIVKGISEESIEGLKDVLSKLVVEKDNSNAWKGWSSAEEENLINEFDSGMSIVAISKLHGRSTRAIRGRLVILKQITGVPKSVKWSSVEDENLIKEYNAGLTMMDIASIHNRTRGAIRARLKKHNLL